MDIDRPHTQARARAFEEVGHRMPGVELRRRIGEGSGLLIREFADETVEKVQELHAWVFADLQKHGHPSPGANGLISALLDAGHAVWFATSAKDEELEHHMQKLGIGGGISGAVNSSAVESGKPAPNIFEEARCIR